MAAEANPWRDDCDHSPCPPLANHGLHEQVNSSASAAAEPDGRVNGPPVEHSRPRAKGWGGKETDGGTPGSAKPEAGARDRMEAGDPALPATEGHGRVAGPRVALALVRAYFLPPRPRVPLAVAVCPTSFLSPPTRRGYLTRVHGLRSACISYGL